MIRWEFFKDCHTCEDVKKTYHKWAKKLHPDEQGNAEEFKRMSAEYERAFEAFKNIHVNAEGESYEKESTETPEQFKDIIDKVIHFDGVNVEIIGSWVWLTGSTMIYKEQIKAAGFWWSKSKKAWYWNGSTEKTKRRGRYSMDGLREKWGSQEVKEDEKTRPGRLGFRPTYQPG